MKTDKKVNGDNHDDQDALLPVIIDENRVTILASWWDHGPVFQLVF